MLRLVAALALARCIGVVMSTAGGGTDTNTGIGDGDWHWRIMQWRMDG
jgi:hypothetical protein